jgi:hypothetical protein
MIASAEAQDELESVEASVGDMVPPKKSKDKKMVAES